MVGTLRQLLRVEVEKGGEGRAEGVEIGRMEYSSQLAICLQRNLFLSPFL